MSISKRLESFANLLTGDSKVARKILKPSQLASGRAAKEFAKAHDVAVRALKVLEKDDSSSYAYLQAVAHRDAAFKALMGAIEDEVSERTGLK